jgi:hypothetical protein
MILCKDCKHHTPDSRNWDNAGLQLRYALCGAVASPVDGWPLHECRSQRSYSALGARLFNKCGEEGRWFVAKGSEPK